MKLDFQLVRDGESINLSILDARGVRINIANVELKFEATERTERAVASIAIELPYDVVTDEHMFRALSDAIDGFDRARVVHILKYGLPLCGFTNEVPARWPRGHVWTEEWYDFSRITNLCTTCQASHKQMVGGPK